jgi:hypothetical protein
MAYQVVAYTPAAFRQLLANYSEASSAVVADKPHARFFDEYFAEMGVCTIVVEEDYVDHDYLEDFSAYYIKCFYPYKRYCTRLHFFRHAFLKEDFAGFLRGKAGALEATLQAAYSGFMVVRPLPSSIVGRTCLAPYGGDLGRRHFSTLASNSANLFGLELTVKTLPFQEQDQVTAACATSALWSAFQATGRMFQHKLPSPVEITRAATVQMPLRSRALPNSDGLTIEQMAHAIREVGLDPYFVAGADQSVVRSALYAYVTAGIPALLVFNLTEETKDGRKSIGYHAAAVTGYSLPPSAPATDFANAFQAIGDRIDKLYVHDDQVGPHARMSFVETGSAWHLSTSWGLGSHTNVHAIPVAILLPLYQKIRIPFTGPLTDIMHFDLALSALRTAIPALVTRPEWNVRLTTVNQLKTEIAKSPLTTGELRENLLTGAFPRFLWHATATNASGLLVDVLFDATDIDSGRYVCRVDIHDPLMLAVVDHVRKNFSDTPIAGLLNSVMGKQHGDSGV